MIEEGYFIDIPATILMGLFLIDLVANIVVLGPKKIWSDRRTLYLELLLQITYWSMLTYYFAVAHSSKSIYAVFVGICAIF